ncbi:hypothetical protein F5Y00DRAFT_225204 [Daldinia vernicosa]|uniref:uncharacterized protein n=1 Tax=Daldinia vernicosa TaxID=114800 RepID=UPI002007D788|nr:uncharacterized protein F5Y00DRAFT_225204 [Daldinia vernicosa]KAI0853040.1 hypothetical protein F5Y00DRAFT_225204 [Daldinia vernicosa]
MLPPSLVSTYQQYKDDTDSIAGWLASTAMATGYVSDSLTPQLPKGRLKGKARAEAKKQQVPSSSKPAPVNKYIIKIEEFVPLAEFIASQQDTSIPNSFITTLHRVITTHRGFSTMLAVKGAITEVEHSHFLCALERVQEILNPGMNAMSTGSTGCSFKAAKDKAAKDKSYAEVTEDELSNQFAGLKVYEPSEDFLDAPDIERPKVPESDNVAYEAESPSLEDVFFALTLLINDINKIRSRIKWIWTNYRDGVFELAACAVTTNTAIDLARKLMEDVVPMFKDHGGLWGVLNDFHIAHVKMKGYEPFGNSPNSDDNFNYDTYDIADGTYIIICRILDAFAGAVQPRAIPLYEEGVYGYYNPRSARDSKSGYQKFEEDRFLLTSFFTDLMAVERGVTDYPVEDEFFRGIKELAKTKEVTFHLIFAAQVFLDIHYILRENVGRGFDTLQVNLHFLAREIEDHFEFHTKHLKIDNWPASNNQIIRHVKGKIQYVLEDPVHEAKIQVYRQLHKPVPASMKPNKMLKMSPVLSGLLLYHFRSDTREIGIRLADAYGSIKYSLHLYNALQSEKLMSNCWPDMKLVWAVLGDTFFVGDTPKAPEDYSKEFSLQMGATAAASTRKRRKSKPLTSRLEPRGLKEGIPVSSMFMKRYLHGTGQVDWTAENVAKIVDLSLWETEGLEEEGTLKLGKIDAEKLKQKPKSIKANKFSKLPPEQLIKALMFALQGEALELAIPYTAMHRECWELLRAVRKHCGPLLRQKFTSKYMEREVELPYVVGWIFTALREGDDKLLAEAGVAVAKFIRSDGKKVLNLLKSIRVPVAFVGEEGV